MGGALFIPLGAIVVGRSSNGSTGCMSWATASLIAISCDIAQFLLWGDLQYDRAGAEGLDSFVSRVVFFIVVFGAF